MDIGSRWLGLWGIKNKAKGWNLHVDKQRFLPPDYLRAVARGNPRVKLPAGISLTSFFILHSQSWNGCHRTNNPGFHLNRGVEMKPSPRGCRLYLHKARWSQIPTCLTPSWFLSTVIDGCRLHKEAWVEVKHPHRRLVLWYYRTGSSLDAQWNSWINNP